jgi:hypothetical protein
MRKGKENNTKANPARNEDTKAWFPSNMRKLPGLVPVEKLIFVKCTTAA